MGNSKEMIRNYSLLLLIVLQYIYADPVRYLDEVFDSYVKTENVVYGNAPDLPFIFLFEWNTYDIDLDMDIYEPVGDTLTNRPVIIFIHTGAFFSGHNELDDVVALSISAAKRGYVAVSINYRLGLNILSTYSGERAVYRGVQDASAAVRYLREFHDIYSIDYENIFIWGTSAGSFIALHLTYADDSERPEATYGNSSDPDLGCVDCEGNSFMHNSRPKALVSCWGAVGDTAWIDPEDSVPSIMFHGTLDPIVPIGVGFPFTLNILLPLVYGSSPIHARMSELGMENEFHQGEGELHEYWGTVNGNWFSGPNEHFEQIKSDAFLFLYNQLYSDELAIDYQSDWNMIGLPLNVENNGYQILFENAVENTLFSFGDSGGYIQEDALYPGTGYWLRFSESGVSTITGVFLYELIVGLSEGWNMISSTSFPVEVTEITDPNGLIISDAIYVYNVGGYTAVETLYPGKGYWIRSSGAGEIIISDN